MTWLQQDALVVAPQLIGWELVSRTPAGTTAGRIVELEVYHGTTDPASHAYRGLTPRTKPMFEAGGTIYVYLSYGIHTCMNITTGPAGTAQAILIRALEPTQGAQLMEHRRRTTKSTLLTSGPGRLTAALGITRDLSGQLLGQGQLSLAPPSEPISPELIATGPRIGIRVATDRLWRYHIANNPFVSRQSTKP